MTLDSKRIGTVDGFVIDARLVEDSDASPSDYDCYDADMVAAWTRDEWRFVGVIVTASRAGIELGSASLWATEFGAMPGVDAFVNPLHGAGDEFVHGYGPDLIREAITEAQAKLSELCAAEVTA